MSRFFARATVVAAIAGSAALLAAGPASAHVTAKVIGESAEQGGYTKITFRVPNEDDAAGTVKLELRLPTDTPITSLRTKPMAGWTAKITKSALAEPIKVHGSEVTEAITSIVWTAASGTRIGPGEFGEFEVSGGPMPETDQLVIPAIQTYDSGKVVAWDAPPTDGEEPERPAPVVTLAAASGDHHGTSTPVAAEAGAGTGGDDHAAAASSDTTARWLGGAGLAVGALGLGIGVGATLRARRLTARSEA
ncbi:YcnI family copper-binding membrane protein [Actinokineospora sp. 24-640]